VEHQLLLRWIAGGAKNDSVKTGELAMEVLPREIFSRRRAKGGAQAIATEGGTVGEDVT
jgi:hypothetical protein